MKKRGPVFATTFCPLMMIVVAVMGSLILAKKIYLGGILGAMLIVAVLYLVLWGKYREHKEKEAEEGIAEPVKCTVGGGRGHNGQSVSVISHDDIEAANNVNTLDSSEVAVAVIGPIPRFPMVAIVVGYLRGSVPFPLDRLVSVSPRACLNARVPFDRCPIIPFYMGFGPCEEEKTDRAASEKERLT